MAAVLGAVLHTVVRPAPWNWFALAPLRPARPRILQKLDLRRCWRGSKPQKAVRARRQVPCTVFWTFVLVCARFAPVCVTLCWFVLVCAGLCSVCVRLCWFVLGLGPAWGALGDKLGDSGACPADTTCLARFQAANDLLRAPTSPLHCFLGVCVGLRAILAGLRHFMLVCVGLCWFVLVCVGPNTNQFQGPRPRLPDYCVLSSPIPPRGRGSVLTLECSKVHEN